MTTTTTSITTASSGSSTKTATFLLVLIVLIANLCDSVAGFSQGIAVLPSTLTTTNSVPSLTLLEKTNNNSKKKWTRRTFLYSSSEEDAAASSSEESLPPPPSPPAPVVQRNEPMDPLIASVTRFDPNVPTRTVPIFGEIPDDGTILLLAPAAAIAVLGFLFSIVVAVQSTDEIVNGLEQLGGNIEQMANQKANMVYDDTVCRGLCGATDAEMDGLRNMMESLRK